MGYVLMLQVQLYRRDGQRVGVDREPRFQGPSTIIRRTSARLGAAREQRRDEALAHMTVAAANEHVHARSPS